jgi:hypothetical protein
VAEHAFAERWLAPAPAEPGRPLSGSAVPPVSRAGDGVRDEPVRTNDSAAAADRPIALIDEDGPVRTGPPSTSDNPLPEGRSRCGPMERSWSGSTAAPSTEWCWVGRPRRP